MTVKKATLAGLVQEFNRLKNRKAKLKKQHDEIGDRLGEVKAEIRTLMNEQGFTKKGDRISVAGKTITLTENEFFNAKDWQKVEAFAKRNNALYLFQRRLSPTAVKDLIESRNGRSIPGIEMFKQPDVSVRTT